MHILMTVNAAWNIWNFRRPIVDALLHQGHKITILAPLDDSVADLEALGCKVIPLKLNAKALNPLATMQLVQQFKRVFRSEKPDIVLSYTIKNNLFGALAAKSLDIPFVPNVTGLGTAFLSGGVLEKIAENLYRRAFRDLKIVFFQNEDDQALFTSRRLVLPEQARLLPGSGINLEHFLATELPKGPPVFLMISRLLRDKGVLEFVEAARLIKSEHPDARFQLLGEIGSKNRTAIDIETVNNWVRDGTIEYLGTAPDVRPIIADATCVVLPSYREGAPRTLIEAASMARPLIATDVPGCRAVVEDRSTGLLCEARNPDSLAKEISRLLSFSHEIRVELGMQGRKKMEREYDQKLVVTSYVQAIDQLTDN